MVRLLALTLTVLTGFSGLAYEVAWQRYLATLLGAHSEATAAVLAIFLGGLSAGYALFGIVTRRLVRRARERGGAPPLLQTYGAVEIAIGVYALCFPELFRAAQGFSLWLPTGGGLLAFAADIALATALIGPPAVLMGGTIPILTQALARDLEDATRLHSCVYALNTLGAFGGALAAGFVLIPEWGLDGVARAMGWVNLGAGATFVALGVGRREVAPPCERTTVETPPHPHRLYGAAALLVGFGTMACQTVLIRVGGLALGSSEFTFAMVVAAFVSAIAAGSLAVAALPKVGRGVLPAALWALAIAFALLYLRVDEAPYWGHYLRSLFRSDEAAFPAFYAAALLATLAVIGPAAALSGAALPLIFDRVRDEMGDLGAQAGRLYCQNTVGSLLGALLGGYALLFWLDLHDVYRVALCAFALGAALVTALAVGRRGRAASLLLLAPALAAVALLPAWDASRLSSGLFRTRDAQPWTAAGPDAVPRRPLSFYEDDPTHSVAVMRGRGDSVSILVNGKPDGNTTGDRETMALAALLPAFFADRAENAFVIGFGTGMTAGYLAELDDVERVTVAEISSAVLRAAPHFDFASFGASRHPKIDLVRSDAYRALLRSEARYDVIVSEPSNPWSAGIEMLFSREFLRAARDHLAEGGVYAQWYHAYENNDRSVQLVLQTFAEVFDAVSVWHTKSTDLLLLGFQRGGAGGAPIDLERLAARIARPDAARLLGTLDIATLPELLVHEGVPVGVVHAAGPVPMRPHTLYHPRLSYEASRGFYAGKRASLPFTGHGEPARVGWRSSLLRRQLARTREGPTPALWQSLLDRACRLQLPHCATLVAAWARTADEHAIREQVTSLRRRYGRSTQLGAVDTLRRLYPDGHSGDLEPLTPEQVLRHAARFRERYYHAFPFSPQALVSLWQRCRQDDAFGPVCRRGLREARAFAAGGRLPPEWAPDDGERAEVARR